MLLLKARRTVHAGIPVVIENPAGSRRHWKDEFTGEKGSTRFEHAYGYIPGANGMDNEGLDVFLGPDPNPRDVYVVTQRKGPEFLQPDEHKIMLGWPDIHAARRAYLAHYTDDRFLGEVHSIALPEFRRRLDLMRDQKLRADVVLGS